MYGCVISCGCLHIDNKWRAVPNGLNTANRLITSMDEDVVDTCWKLPL
jgi:hypothetical protein